MDADSKTRYVAQRNDTVKMYLNNKYLISRPLASLEFTGVVIPIEVAPHDAGQWGWLDSNRAEGLMSFSVPKRYIQYIPDPPVEYQSNNFWLDLEMEWLQVISMACYNTGKYGDYIIKDEIEPVKVEVHFQTGSDSFRRFIDAWKEINNAK